MRYVHLLFVLVFFVALNAGAQVSSSNSESLTPSTSELPNAPAAPVMTAALIPSPFGNSAPVESGIAGQPVAFSLEPTPAAPPQDVTSVFERYSWQLYLGYTFFRFYEYPSQNGIPGHNQSLNGFDYGMVYYVNNWFGGEGDFSATHGTQFGQSAWFVSGTGGPRFRWAARRNIEVWAHALIGYSHFRPQTPFGGQSALAYQFGGGVDLPFKPRWAFRLSGDAVGTQYFSTYQYSPKFTAGVLFKF